MKPDLAADLSTPPKKRLTLDLFPEDIARLERIQKRVRARSKASCLRYALQLYEAILDHREEIEDKLEVPSGTIQLYWHHQGRVTKVRLPVLR